MAQSAARTGSSFEAWLTLALQDEEVGCGNRLQIKAVAVRFLLAKQSHPALPLCRRNRSVTAGLDCFASLAMTASLTGGRLPLAPARAARQVKPLRRFRILRCVGGK
jgi:hypothetical protein